VQHRAVPGTTLHPKRSHQAHSHIPVPVVNS
jgi:hypothetical protein